MVGVPNKFVVIEEVVAGGGLLKMLAGEAVGFPNSDPGLLGGPPNNSFAALCNSVDGLLVSC